MDLKCEQTHGREITLNQYIQSHKLTALGPSPLILSLLFTTKQCKSNFSQQYYSVKCLLSFVSPVSSTLTHLKCTVIVWLRMAMTSSLVASSWLQKDAQSSLKHTTDLVASDSRIVLRPMTCKYWLLRPSQGITLRPITNLL